MTSEQIAKLKEEHKDVYAVETGGHIGYLRKPKRKDISYASIAGKVDPIKFNEAILRTCWLGGSEAIRTDDDKFMAASGVLADLIEVADAELKKL